jgi:hypothetical protein
VPVYLSNEDYQVKPPRVAQDEYRAWQKIYVDAVHEKRDSGTVCVYLVDANSKGLDSMVVSRAAEKDNLVKMLKRAVDRLQVKGGEPVVAPVCQAAPPAADPGDLRLHLTARAADRGSWGEFPSENWIVLKEKEWAAWLPSAPRPGMVYSIPQQEAAKILVYFFPQTEICDFGRATDPDGPYQHRIERLVLKGRVLGTEGDTVRVRLDGRVRLKHNFYPGRPDQNYADSTVVGYLEWDRTMNRVGRLRLATTRGEYGKRAFGVAVTGGE